MGVPSLPRYWLAGVVRSTNLGYSSRPPALICFLHQSTDLPHHYPYGIPPPRPLRPPRLRLSFGAATFGGGNEFFTAWGNTGVDEARRSSTSASTPASTFLTPPTATPTAFRKRSSAKLLAQAQSAPDLHQGLLPHGRRSQRPRLLAQRISRRRATPALNASAPTTSTSTICMPSTPSRPSKRLWTR